MAMRTNIMHYRYKEFATNKKMFHLLSNSAMPFSRPNSIASKVKGTNDKMKFLEYREIMLGNIRH